MGIYVAIVTANAGLLLDLLKREPDRSVDAIRWSAYVRDRKILHILLDNGFTYQTSPTGSEARQWLESELVLYNKKLTRWS
jgi:hypothetical protein